MYLVELRPGREELYRSVDELAAAIRRGDVDGHSRIFHRATSKWISITVHPQFKAITSEREPLPSLPHKQWTFLADADDGDDTRSAPPAQPERSEPAEHGPSALNGRARWRRALAFGGTGLLLMLGVQLAFSGPRPPWTRVRDSLTPAPAVSGERPASSPAGERRSTVTLASSAGVGESGVGYPLPDVGAGNGVRGEPAWDAGQDAPVLPKAPAVRIKKLGSPLVDSAAGKSTEAPSVESLKAHYRAAYDSAHVRIQAKVDSLIAAER